VSSNANNSLQSIVLYEFLPALLGISKEEMPAYGGYNPHVPPGISHSFATTAFRFPHTLVPPALFLRKRTSKCEFRKEASFGFDRLLGN
jgi:dual oxidase